MNPKQAYKKTFHLARKMDWDLKKKRKRAFQSDVIEFFWVMEHYEKQAISAIISWRDAK